MQVQLWGKWMTIENFLVEWPWPSASCCGSHFLAPWKHSHPLPEPKYLIYQWLAFQKLAETFTKQHCCNLEENISFGVITVPVLEVIKEIKWVIIGKVFITHLAILPHYCYCHASCTITSHRGHEKNMGACPAAIRHSYKSSGVSSHISDNHL